MGVVSSTHNNNINKVCSCMVLWVLFRVPTTTTFNKVCSCMVLWVLFRVPTTTTFNKVCSCMVLWVLFRVPTTTTFNKVCSCMVLWVLFIIIWSFLFARIHFQMITSERLILVLWKMYQSFVYIFWRNPIVFQPSRGAYIWPHNSSPLSFWFWMISQKCLN